MGATTRILAILVFSAAFSKIDASKDEDGSIYNCLSGHECQGAIITTHQGGEDYCCGNGHTLILEMNSDTEEENWFEFDEALWSDFLHMFMDSGDKNKKSVDNDKHGSEGRDKQRGSVFRDDRPTEPGPDGVAIDQAFVVNPGHLGTPSSDDFDGDVQIPVNDSLPEARLPGQKPKAEVESFAEDYHYPTANYNNARERGRDSPRRKGDVESGDQTPPENKMENLVKYKMPASDMEKVLSAFFPRSNLARKLTRRDVEGERKRDVVTDDSEDSISPNVVTLNSFGKMVVTPDTWMVRCLCNARSNPHAKDLLGVIMEYLKKLWFF